MVTMVSFASFMMHLGEGQCGSPRLWPISCNTMVPTRFLNLVLSAICNRLVETTQPGAPK